MNHEQLEQRQVMAADSFQLIGIQNNDGDLLEDNEVLNSSPHNLTLRFDENHVIDPTTIVDGIRIYRAGPNNVLGDDDDVQIVGNGAAFGGFIGIGDTPNEIVIRFGEALPDDQYRLEVTESLLGTETATGDIDPALASSTTFELNLGAQILSIVPQPMSRDDQGNLTVETDKIYIYLNDDDLDSELAQDPGYYQLLFQATSGSTSSIQNGEIAFFPTDVEYDAALDRIVLTFSDSLDELATGASGYDPTAPTVYRLQIGSKEITSKEWTGTLGVDTINTNTDGTDAGDTFDTATELVGPGVSGNLLDGNHEFEVTRAAHATHSDGNGGTVYDIVGQIFTIDDGAGTVITFELTNGATTTNPVADSAIDISAFITNTASTRADLAALIAAGIENGFASLPTPVTVDVDLANAALSDTRYKITSPDGRPKMQVSETTVGLIVDRSQTIVIHGEIENVTPYELNLPGASDEPGHREDYVDQQSHLLGTADDHAGITEFRYGFPVQYGVSPSPGNPALINVITEAQKQRTREIMALYSYYSGVTFVEVAYDPSLPWNAQQWDLGVVTGDLRGVAPTIPSAPGGVAGIAGGGLVIMDILDHQNAGDDEYGAAWQRTAIHEIGHFLGLGHAYELPPTTTQSGGENDYGLIAENIFPGDNDIVHMQYMYNPESKDIDLYKLEIPEMGRLTAEILAERLVDPNTGNALSSLDALITIYQENGDGTRTIIARNDDYYSEDSFVELLLEQGTYYVGVSASGNNAYDPSIPDSGFGGKTQGQYDLQIRFRPDATNAIKDTGAELESGASIQVRTDAQSYSDGDLDFDLDGRNTITITDAVGVDVTYELDFKTDLSDPDTVSGSNIPVPVLIGAGSSYRASDIVAALVDAINNTTDTFANFKAIATNVGNRIDLSNVASNDAVVFSSPIEMLDSLRVSAGASEGAALDGDLDGAAGGNYNFWFRAETSHADGTITPLDEPIVIYVDKTSTRGGQNMPALDGTLERPFNSIQDAINFAEQRNVDSINLFGKPVGDVIRIVGNDQDLAYYIGYDTTQQTTLEDGLQLIIPQSVTVMIDEGAILKFGVGGSVVVGSTSVTEDRSYASLQVLGVPERFDPYVNADNEVVQDEVRTGRRVIFTSYNEDGVGDRSNLQFAPTAGDWGGIFFNNEVDREQSFGSWQDNGIFLNSVVGGDFRFGGGVTSISGREFTLAPVYMEESRPALYFNQVVSSAGGAFSADPNSFEKTNFQVYNGGSDSESYRTGQFNQATPDYSRSGPAIFGNDFVADTGVLNAANDTDDPSVLELYDTNSYNGIVIRIATPAGNQTEKLTVTANFDDTDIVHVLFENLLIQGTPGGQFIDEFGVLHARLDAALMIDPNIVLKSNGARIEVEMGANFIAEGSSGNEVIMTSLHDDRYGFGGTFDTNGNGVLTTAAEGDWSGIYFGQTSTGSLDNVILAYGGGNSRINGGLAFFNAIEIHQATVRVANSVLESNADGLGVNDTGSTRSGHSANAIGTIFVAGAQPIIIGNNFLNNESASINIDVNSLNKDLVVDTGRSTGFVNVTPGVGDNQGALVRFNMQTNNGLNGMIVRGGVLNTEGVWDDTDIVHILFDEIVIPDLHTYGGLRIESSSRESLVVKLRGMDAGITASGTPLDIEDRIGGTLHVVGQPGYPVVFTSLYDDTVGAGFDQDGMSAVDTNNDNGAQAPGPGDWRSLLIDEYANDRNVDTIVEAEINNAVSVGTNGTPQTGQALGILAPDEYAGDDNRRLGFEVHGFLSSPSDVDVYSFQAIPGTEVWIDLDLTTYALDAIIELIDDNGNVIARSIDNETLFGSNAAADQLNTMPKSGMYDEDRWTINPRDPSMRIVLTGDPTSGSVSNYHIRIRSNSDNLGTSQNASGSYLVNQDQLTSGLTSGVYQMQVRLREIDEFGGSTIKQADVRYATNGIEVLGQPAHSPLLGESAESPDNNNDTLGTAQNVGNVLTTDRDAISIAGQIATTGDVDWFEFDLTREYLQSIPGFSADDLFASLILDIDYMAGARGNASIAVFDASGQLVLVSSDSNVSDDQANTQFIANAAYDPNYAQFGDLERGSLSTGDPYIGTISVPQGRYYVAVTSAAQIPGQLEQFYTENPTNPLVRMEPIDSIQRIVEEHIGGNSTATAGAPDITTFLSSNQQVKDYHLSDMVMFVSVDVGNERTQVWAINPFTGAVEAYLGEFGYDVGDIAMHPDGSLYAYSIDTAGANVPQASSNGNFLQINTGTGAAQFLRDDGLQTYAFDVENKVPIVDHPVGQDRVGYGYDWNALAYGYLGGANSENLRGYVVGNRGGAIDDPDRTDDTNILYRTDASEIDGNGVNRGEILDSNGTSNNGTGNGGRYFQTGAADAVAVGQILTQFDSRTPSSTAIITRAATTFDSDGVTILSNYVDGNMFSLDADGDSMTLGDQFTVELNLGYDLLFDSFNRTIQDNNAGRITRSGGVFAAESQTFDVGADTYETVYDDFIDFGAFTGLTAADEGSILRITDETGTDLFILLEDNSDGSTTDTASIVPAGFDTGLDSRAVVQFQPGQSAVDLMNSIVKAINDNSSVNNATSNFDGTAYISGNAIAVVGDASMAISGGFGGTSINLQNTVGVGNIPVVIDLAPTELEYVTAIANAINGQTPGVASQFDTRLTVLATSADFSGLLVGQNALTVTADTANTGDIVVDIGAADDAATVAMKIAAAVDAHASFTASSANALVTFNAGAATVTDDEMLFEIGGIGSGGTITGLAILQGNMYAVDDAGGVFHIYGANGGTFESDYLGTIEDGGNPVSFVSLDAGPDTISVDSLQDVLFAMSSTGRMYAIRTSMVNGYEQADLAPAFAGGRTSIASPVGGTITGVAFSTLNRNLWHTTTTREGDAGHGINVPVSSYRDAEQGGASFWFGNERDTYLQGNPYGNATNNNYDLPGGAHGTLITEDFSLYGYDATDLPVLYFNYFSDTDNVNGDLARDALRVFIAGDDGNWQQLATNNNSIIAGTNNDEFDLNDKETLEPRAATAVQQIYDSSGTWRQVRIDLSTFAGMDNLKLRFDFSTGGQVNIGGVGVADNNTAFSADTSEIRALDSNKHVDGEIFSVQDPYTGEIYYYEINKGQTFTTGSYAEFNEGDSFTLVSAGGAETFVFEFDKEGDGANTGDVAIMLEVSDTPETIAEKIRQAVDGAFTVPVRIFRDGNAITIRDIEDIATGDRTAVTSEGVTRIVVDTNGTIRGLAIEGFESTLGTTPVLNNIDGTADIGLAGEMTTIIDLHDDRFVTSTPDANGEQRIGDETIAQIMQFMFHDTMASLTVQAGTTIPTYLAFPRHDEFVFMVGGYNVTRYSYLDASSLDAIQARIGLDEKLQGDTFGVMQDFITSVNTNNGVVDVFNTNTGQNRSRERGVDNANQGVFIDDLIIGFAERGEMITGATGNATNFIANPDSIVNDTFVGEYQLELREGTEYVFSGGPYTSGYNAGTVWDTNDRLSFSSTIEAPAGDKIADNARIEISDGVDTLVFRMWDLDQATDFPTIQQDQIAGVYTVGYRESWSEADVARALTAAINDTTGQKARNLTESTRTFGVIARVNSQEAALTTSGQIDLSPKDPYTDEVIVGLLGTTGAGTLRVTEGNNDFFTSDLSGDPNSYANRVTNTRLDGVTIPGYAEFHARGQIGDNPLATDPNDASLSGDVDMYRVELGLGNTIQVDVEALSLGSPLATAIRLFYFDGTNTTEVALEQSAGGNDPSLVYYNDPITGNAGHYIIAVSHDTNVVYNPMVTPTDDANSNRTYSDVKGMYELNISLDDGYVNPFEFVDYGRADEDDDQNAFRDQGQIIISSNRVSYSSGWGILVDAAPRGSAADGGDNLPNQGAPRVTRELNTARLATGVTIVNNIIFNNDTGAILYSGDTSTTGQAPGSVPVGRIINNTLYGAGVGVGIQVEDQAGPWIVNNIIANFATGIFVEADVVSPEHTRISRTAFRDNASNAGGAATTGQSPILLANSNPDPTVPDADPLFVDAANGNFYLMAGSQVIDASIDSIGDRDEFTSVYGPLGIETSPVVAPTRDQSGQLRYDDPLLNNSPGGVGERAVKDLGALDRADSRGPSGKLVSPQDNDAANLDLDQTNDVVQLLNGPLTNISIQLIDSSGLSSQPQGSGIDDTTVTADSFFVQKISGGEVEDLFLGVDYRFAYDATNNVIRLTSVSGVFEEGVTYKITLKNRFTPDVDEAVLIRDNAGNSIEPNKVDGNETSFFIRVGGLLDFGDAPDQIGGSGYGTYVENDGARHQIREGFHLGSGIDSELNASPHADASGDNFDDGVEFGEASTTTSGSLLLGKVNQIFITATVPLNETNYGFVQAWVDLNGDGMFDNENELVLDRALGQDAVNGANGGAGQLINFSVPSGTAQDTVMRVRYSSTGGLNVTGLAIDGEVEDYAVTLSPGLDNPWHNYTTPSAVTRGDSAVTTHDLAMVLYEIRNREYTDPNTFQFDSPWNPDTDGFDTKAAENYFGPQGVPAYLDVNDDYAVSSADVQIILDYFRANPQQFDPEAIDMNLLDGYSLDVVNPAVENTPLVTTPTSEEQPVTVESVTTESFAPTFTTTSSSLSESTTISSNPMSQPTVDLFGVSFQQSRTTVTTVGESQSATISHEEIDASFTDEVLLGDSFDAMLDSVADDISDAWRVDAEDADDFDDLIALISDEE
ncbi:GEVED domain-containing protein [Blastopirellula retiformator]|uniref:GEVED domain-containing protein n=1 Tax=Blastopirellula retiformator TaxID=2527970 RepID=UPI0011B7A6BB|nr:GEVED domain-containing protein [Blastopirellula retiformator]